jgi:hypothetical protein
MMRRNIGPGKCGFSHDGLCEMALMCEYCYRLDHCRLKMQDAFHIKQKPSAHYSCFACKYLKAVFLGVECTKAKKKTVSADTQTAKD